MEEGEITQPLLLSNHPSGGTFSGSQSEAVGSPPGNLNRQPTQAPAHVQVHVSANFREFMETVSQVWSFKAGLRTGAGKALGWEADAHNRLPERGKSGPEIPKDLFKCRQTWQLGDSVGTAQGTRAGSLPGEKPRQGLREKERVSPPPPAGSTGATGHGDATALPPGRPKPAERRCLGRHPAPGLPG